MLIVFDAPLTTRYKQLRATYTNQRSWTINPLKMLLLTILLLSSSSQLYAEQPPKVPFIYGKGKNLYQANCAICHGKWIEGTKQGPPLFHPYYKPSHHGDPAFYRAALKGVFEHHWKFGAMPAIKGVTKKDMDSVVPFIRWLQKEKGLY